MIEEFFQLVTVIEVQHRYVCTPYFGFRFGV